TALSTITKTTFNINTPVAASSSINNYDKLLFGYSCNDIEKIKIVGVLLLLLLMPLRVNYYYHYYLIGNVCYVSYDIFHSGAF
ncbi:MAG TPA: hypothetical protein VIP56_01850, partial [Nitrososphaeraceae archaeon]